LQSLARFNYYLAEGAITPTELCPDFGYFVKLMRGDPWVSKRKGHISDGFVMQLNSYLDYWENDYAKNFLATVDNACP
jgi:hypothetical protein